MGRAERSRLRRPSIEFRPGNVVWFMPYPIVGGFLAGTGWLLLKGGIASPRASQKPDGDRDGEAD